MPRYRVAVQENAVYIVCVDAPDPDRAKFLAESIVRESVTWDTDNGDTPLDLVEVREREALEPQPMADNDGDDIPPGLQWAEWEDIETDYQERG